MSIIDDVRAELTPPPPPPAAREWARCKHWIEQALEGNAYTIEHVEQELTMPGSKLQFWPGKASAIITELQHKGNEVVLYCWLAGGDMAEIMAMAPGLEAYGRIAGAASVLVEGRKGWEKMLRDAGYHFESLTLKKVL